MFLINIIASITIFAPAIQSLSFFAPAFPILFQEPLGRPQLQQPENVRSSLRSTKSHKEEEEKIIDLKVKGNSKFLSKLWKFRKALYPFSKEIDSEIEEILSDPLKRGSSLIISHKHQTEIQIPSCYDYMDNFAGRLRVHKKIVDMGENDNGVFIVEDRSTGRKYIHKLFGKDREYDAEIGFFNSISHPNIVKPLCLVKEMGGRSTRKGLVMDYIDGETSVKWAKRKSTTREMLKEAAVSLANTLQYIHRRGYTHGGIKPENVMIERNSSKVILIDFGYTFHSSHGGNHIRPLYKMKAPEINNLLYSDPSEGTDFWSYGQLIGNWFSFKDIPGHRMIVNVPDSATGIVVPRARGTGLYMVKISSNTNYEFEEFSLAPFPSELRRLLSLLLSPSPLFRSFMHQGTWEYFKGQPFFREVQHLFNED